MEVLRRTAVIMNTCSSQCSKLSAHRLVQERAAAAARVAAAAARRRRPAARTHHTASHAGRVLGVHAGVHTHTHSHTFTHSLTLLLVLLVQFAFSPPICYIYISFSKFSIVIFIDFFSLV